MLVVDFGLSVVRSDESEERDFRLHKELSDVFLPNAYGVVRANLNLEIASPSPGEKTAVRTNAYGMRMGKVSLEKEPKTVRVAVVGDSVAFGWMLPEELAFPHLLQEILDRDNQTKYEVLNFAAPGYTSFHAVKQYERLVHNFKPDILILALGLYDSFESRITEKELYALLEEYDLVRGLSGVPRLWHDYSTIGHWVSSRKRKQGYEALQQFLQDRTLKGEWHKKVTLEEFKGNLSALIGHHHEQGGRTILAHVNFVNYYAAQILKDLAGERKIPLMDARLLFDGLGGVQGRKKTLELGLMPAGVHNGIPGNYRYLFRVYAPLTTDASSLFIVGDHPKLGDGTPGRAALYDDGNHGDERAGDRIFSLEIETGRPERLHFAFTKKSSMEKSTMEPLSYENMYQNRLHYERVDLSSYPSKIRWASIVYTYGRVPYTHLVLSDNPELPNAMGHEAIAKRLARLVREIEGIPSPSLTIR